MSADDPKMSAAESNETSTPTVADADATFIEADFFATPLNHAGQTVSGS